MDPGNLSPPPPSYSEQDFDRKVSDALEASLNAPQPEYGEEEEWEEWDDAIHVTAAEAISSLDNSRSSGSGSSHGLGAGSRLPDKKVSPAIEPLRIQKKAQNAPHSPSDQAKLRPSWLAETETGQQSSASGSSTLQHDIPPEDDEDHSIPPPPFSSVNPSLDSNGQPVIIMAYHPSGESRPPSPLNSPVRVPLAIPAHDHENMSLSQPPSRIQPEPESYAERLRPNDQAAPYPHRPARRSLPTVPHPSHQVGQRPSTAYAPKPQHSPAIPRINFDPYMAYNYEEGLPHARLPIQHFEPNAFYNSAVSAHLSAARTPARQSHLGTSSQQSPYHFHPADQNTGRHSFLHDSHVATGHQVPVALTPSLDSWQSGTSANMSMYSQPPRDARYSPNPQHRPR